MIYTLEVLKAHEGDCMLLHWGTRAQPKLAVVDGGPSDTYETYLRPRLDLIQSKRQPSPLEIEFVMVSHVDNDHIVGVKKMFSDLHSEVQRQVPEANRPIKVRRLWHNTFDDVVANRLSAHYEQFTASFTADGSGELPSGSRDIIKQGLEERGEAEDDDQAEHLALDISKVLAGHAEARDLRDKHRFLYQAQAIGGLNRPFTHRGGSTLITAELTPRPLSVAGLTFHIVGPRQAEIEALQADFDAYLQKKGLNTAEATLAAYADNRVPNLSSIVCIGSIDVGGTRKSILLTGDARGDKMIEGLRSAGYLSGNADEHLHVNVLKVPHHGSNRNVRRDFFRKITADVYVLSGDGKHGNPDVEVFEWITESRRRDEDFTIAMTYSVAVTDARRKAEARSPWQDERHSIAHFVSAKRQEGYSFRLEEDAPILIELGDEAIDW
ncbi:MAG: hypothetical protein M3177_03610 [Pseudomonadota bacterium]|nr:hypothetical protein [Pseudomonadota bacterium]